MHEGPDFAHSSEKLVTTRSEPRFCEYGQGVVDFGVIKA